MQSYRRSGQRRGTAAVELALVLPLLMFLLLVATDYCRVFYFSQVVTTCARNGALYASDSIAASRSPYRSLDEAARGDADGSISAQLTVNSTSGTDSLGAYTVVTVSYPFGTTISYPGIPRVVTLTRTARVRVAPVTPK